MRKNLVNGSMHGTYTANGIKPAGKSQEIEIVGTGNKSFGAKLTEMLLAIGLLIILIILVINLPAILR